MNNKNDNFKEELENQYKLLIQAETKEQQKRTFAIVFILLITLFSTMITSIYAYKVYKSTKETHEEIKEESKTFYKSLEVSYNNSSILDLTNITGNYTLENPKIITITNEGTEELSFSLKLSSITTNLESSNGLYYTLTKNNEETSRAKKIPQRDATILQEQKISPEETINYIINISYDGYIDPMYSFFYRANLSVEMNSQETNLLE